MHDPIDLDHIDRLLAEATPGPWEVGNPDLYSILDTGGESVADAWMASDTLAIVAVRNAAPAMVAEIRRLRAEVQRSTVRATIERIEDYDRAAEMWRSQQARAREDGRAEERAAVLRYLATADGDLEEAAGDIEEGYHCIERGKHREEDDNG